MVVCAATGKGNMAFWWWAGLAAFDRVQDAPNRECSLVQTPHHSIQKALGLRLRYGTCRQQGLASASQVYRQSGIGNDELDETLEVFRRQR